VVKALTIGFLLASAASAFMGVTLLRSQPNVAPIVLIPVLIAAFPMLAARTRIARFAAILSALAMLGFVALGIMSIGMFYFPAAIAILIAAFAPVTARQND
jgi:hypothetical protein